jgi:hypothetical protein
MDLSERLRKKRVLIGFDRSYIREQYYLKVSFKFRININAAVNIKYEREKNFV